MKISDLIGIVMAALSVFVLVTFMHSNAAKADRFAACEVRGGKMVKIDGGWLCEVRK